LSVDSRATGRVIRDLRELAELTSDEGGAQRMCWTDTWDSARKWLESKALELALSVSQDEAGNQWIVLPGNSESVLAIGGHLDSVANGGWLDGALNVLAGLDVLRRFAESGAKGVTLALVNWADEEGARFGRSLFGSSAATGALDIAAVRRLIDESGVALPDAVAAYGVDLDRVLESRSRLAPVKAYLELHIEQGPVLESLDLPLGVVLGTCGVRRDVLRFIGQAAHAGPTPIANRRDAGIAGARFSLALRECAIRHSGVATVGTFRLEPGLPTIVPGACELIADMRHLDRLELSAMVDEMHATALWIAKEERVSVEWRPLVSAEPMAFDETLIEICEGAARDLGVLAPRMPSGALHDATSMAAAGFPTAMIFVRSLGGLSHCAEEDSLEVDIDIAVETLHLATTRALESIAASTN